MTEAMTMSTVETILVSALMVAGAGFALLGSFGLVRLHNFYQRVHAPTLGTTLGTALMAVASIVYFSATGGRLVIHELLIVALVTVTTPVGLIIVVRAALFRDSVEAGETDGGPGRR